jgi:hypothetical protein
LCHLAGIAGLCVIDDQQMFLHWLIPLFDKTAAELHFFSATRDYSAH